MGKLNLGDAFELAAEVRGEAEALVQGEGRVGWRELDARAGRLAAWMLGQGATRQGKVALFTYNHPAYLEGVFAAFKAALVPVNVNYRYKEDELRYLFENSDSEFVIVHADFVPMLAKLMPELSGVRAALVVGDDLGELEGETLAFRYEDVASGRASSGLEFLGAAERSGDDLILLYTGGTTGLPKGVMWTQDALYDRLGGGALAPSPATLEDLRAYYENPGLRLRMLVGCPLMHGTGWFMAVTTFLTGGTVVMMEHPEHFDPAEFWSTVEREKVNAATIVGDSFAKPLLRELERAVAAGSRYDLSSLVMMASSGVMWSTETKQGLLAHHPGMLLVDVFSSSEALGMGTSIMSAAGPVPTAQFQPGENARLFDETLAPLETAPGAQGLIGVGGAQPIGYYKDPEKSARTFVRLQEGTFSIPGDWALVGEDGKSLQLLGRGSVCINTGGEKVFPEEVEEIVKRYGGVRDCVVVGVPDETWGEAITAVVSCMPGEDVDPAALTAFVKGHLASYKAPKHVLVIDDVYRSPSGKADFKRTKQQALDLLGGEVADV